MNMTLNSLAPTPAALDAAAVTAAAPGMQPVPGAAPAVADAAPAVFAQWLGLGRQADVAALFAGADAAAPLAEGTQAPAADATDASEATEATAPADAADSADQPAAPAQQDVVLLAAMSMPLMAPPSSAAFIRTAVPMPTDQQGAGAAPAALPLSAAELRTGLGAAARPLATASDAVPAAAGASPVAAQPAASSAQPAAAGAHSVAAAQPVTTAADAGPADAAQASDASAAPSAERPAGAWGVGTAASAPASARVPADSVALAGPPTAWRQTLHEALGERLNLQLSSRAEQAVIRLEPPMLGRVDIAIRHSAGALEVTISATHGEVVRQLQAVSENLRNDLAQRQFTDVAVTVAQAPRGAQAAPHGDQQGRGRQPAREDQPQDPGRSLAEAGDASSTFSLNGRA